MVTKSVKHTNTDFIWQQSFTSLSVCYEKMGLPQCKNLWNFFSVSLTNAGVWLLFKGLLALLSPLFYVIQELDRLWAKKKSTKITIHSIEQKYEDQSENYTEINFMLTENEMASMILSFY